ncbi:hypothetical protein SAMN06296386_106169 [Lachnospiraceae bacterium]|nr:hypothetical protein SAMN06296386_106169 [Lachnospiraceae bacterium]
MKIEKNAYISFSRGNNIHMRNNLSIPANQTTDQTTTRTEATCAFCGAPVRTELCPYCGNPTGLNTADAVLDYPELSCKEASLTFWNTLFPMIFAAAFAIFGFMIPFALSNEGFNIQPLGFIFALPSIICFAIILLFVWRYFTVSTFGKEIEGTVYGYMDDTVYYNNIPGQVCKILVNSKHGPRFIMYKLKNVHKPYKVNTKLPLKVYKDRFLIVNKHRYEAWN